MDSKYREVISTDFKKCMIKLREGSSPVAELTIK